jgi:hypothetical protein
MQLRFGQFHKACDKECLAERDGADKGNSEHSGKSPDDGERGIKVFDFEAAVSQEEAQSSPAEELLALETHNCATTSRAGGAPLSILEEHCPRK